jgi:hypothetical protein
MMAQKLKIVACTKLWKAEGLDKDLPMWRPGISNEYIIAHLDEPEGGLTLAIINEHVLKFQHMLEGQIRSDVVEIFTGYEVYVGDNLTHNEQFQLQSGGAIDFPAVDLTKVDVSDELT